MRPGDAGWYVGGELLVGFGRSGGERYGGQQICQVHFKRYEDLLFPGPHVLRVEECQRAQYSQCQRRIAGLWYYYGDVK